MTGPSEHLTEITASEINMYAQQKLQQSCQNKENINIVQKKLGCNNYIPMNYKIRIFHCAKGQVDWRSNLNAPQ
jgi:hypothetical protein